jgi:hypothetical protein
MLLAIERNCVVPIAGQGSEAIETGNGDLLASVCTA